MNWLLLYNYNNSATIIYVLKSNWSPQSLFRRIVIAYDIAKNDCQVLNPKIKPYLVTSRVEILLTDCL